MHNELAVGDNVLLGRCEGGQKYIVLDRLYNQIGGAQMADQLLPDNDGLASVTITTQHLIPTISIMMMPTGEMVRSMDSVMGSLP